MPMIQSVVDSSPVSAEPELRAAAFLFDSLSKPSRLAIIQHLTLGDTFPSHRVK